MQLIMEPEPVADAKQITTMVDTEPTIQEKLTNGVEEIKNGMICKEKEPSDNELDLNKAWEEINVEAKVVDNGESNGKTFNVHETHKNGEKEKQEASVADNRKDVANNNLQETENNAPKIDEAEDIIPKDNEMTPSDKAECVPENANKTDEVFKEHDKNNTELKNNDQTEDKTGESVEMPVTAELNEVTHENNFIENNLKQVDAIAEHVANDVNDTGEDSLKVNGVSNTIEKIPDDTQIQKESVKSADAVEIEAENSEIPKSPPNDSPSEIENEQANKTTTTEAKEIMDTSMIDTDKEMVVQSLKSVEADINKTINLKSATDSQTESENNKIGLPESNAASIVKTFAEEINTSPNAETKSDEPVKMASLPDHIAESVNKDVSSEAMDVEESASEVLPESEKPIVNVDSDEESKNENMDVDPVPKSDNFAEEKVLKATENTEKMDTDSDKISVIKDDNKKSDNDILSEKVSQPEAIEVATDATKSEEVKTTDITAVLLGETDIKLDDETDVTSETKISEIPAEVTKRKKSDDQKDLVVTNEDVNEIMDSDDEKEAEKAKTVKAGNDVQELKDTTKHSAETKPQKRTFLGLANTLDILSDDEDSESKDKEPKKTKISADTDENKCINLDDDNDTTEVSEKAKDDRKSISNTLDILSDDEAGEQKIEEQKKTEISADTDASKCINLDDDKAPLVTEKAKDDKCISNTLDILSDDEESEQKPDEHKNKEISANTDSKCINLDDDKDTTEVSEKPKDHRKSISNTLDILSDDEAGEQKIEEQKKTEISGDTDASKCVNLDDEKAPEVTDKTKDDKCISIDDDDDVMLIDEEMPKESAEKEKSPEKEIEKVEAKDSAPEVETDEDSSKPVEVLSDSEKEVSSPPKPVIDDKLDINEKPASPPKEKKPVNTKPLVPDNFLKKFKANVAEMTRDELEEFCLLKIVEAVIDRSNLSDISSKLKKLSTNVEEWKKKAMMLTKQNRDLQIVVNTVQEEHQKRAEGIVTPLKITRSVGMQVVMTDSSNDKIAARRKTIQPIQPAPPLQGQTRGGRTYTPRAAKQQPVNPPNIPVPRLVPAANNSPLKTTRQVQQVKSSPTLNKITTPPVRVEKRSYTTMQSVTVDLTDDEPAPKQQATAPRNNQVRLVSPQQLLTPRAQINAANSPRKVFIPINAPNNLRPGQTIMIKPGGPGPRGPRGSVVRMSQAPVRMGRAPGQRHPAPLPEAPKQPQHNMWKALPPEPDLKISKVENGIVISWKIEGYQEDSYEEIASYQLYAYQETSSPPNTLLWKKIGDVKALPLPMACTLTQFMAGFKYYFAVRAVDVKSRIGPFSLPGSILLLNK